MLKRTLTIDFDAVACDPRHLSQTGKGWAKLLRQRQPTEDEIITLVQRLKDGMAAQIELQRIYSLAGIAARGDGSGLAGKRHA